MNKARYVALAALLLLNGALALEGCSTAAPTAAAFSLREVSAASPALCSSPSNPRDPFHPSDCIVLGAPVLAGSDFARSSPGL